MQPDKRKLRTSEEQRRIDQEFEEGVRRARRALRAQRYRFDRKPSDRQEQRADGA